MLREPAWVVAWARPFSPSRQLRGHTGQICASARSPRREAGAARQRTPRELRPSRGGASSTTRALPAPSARLSCSRGYAACRPGRPVAARVASPDHRQSGRSRRYPGRSCVAKRAPSYSPSIAKSTQAFGAISATGRADSPRRPSWACHRRRSVRPRGVTRRSSMLNVQMSDRHRRGPRSHRCGCETAPPVNIGLQRLHAPARVRRAYAAAPLRRNGPALQEAPLPDLKRASR